MARKNRATTPQSRHEIGKEYMEHLDKAALLRKQLNDDLALAKIDDEFEVLTFDLQTIHPLPYLNTK